MSVFRSCFLVMFMAYPGVSLKVLRVFQCRTIDGVSYLEADMRLQVRGGSLSQVRVCLAHPGLPC